MRVLVACEESQAVCIAFRERGHEAYSCDLQECSGGHPEWHIQGDVFEIIEQGWDLMIAHPPCTHLAVSGAAWFEQKRKDGRQQQGIDFFLELTKTNIPKWAIENPVGIMSTHFRKPNQIINPWQFGDSFSKATCLWLNNMPVLLPTQIVSKGNYIQYESGKRMPEWYAGLYKLKPAERAKMRSKTSPGIARAMASQWSELL